MRTSFKEGSDGKLQPSLRREDHLLILRALWEQRPTELFPRVTVPTLIVPARRPNPTGRAAEMAPIRAQLVANAARAIPNARLLWMEDTVHDIPLQRPAELAEAIESVAGPALG
jgi:pimeloyl-ACP methyl ester carboxylesterase